MLPRYLPLIQMRSMPIHGGNGGYVRRFALQKCVSLVLVVLAPLAFAQDTGVAVLSSTGPVFLNGGQLSNSNAVVAGDVIQTKESGTATINGPGGSIAIEPNSIVRFQGQSVALDRGQISVGTGKVLSVNTRDLRITPVSSDWTQYSVTRNSGIITIAARKNDVTISCGAGDDRDDNKDRPSRAGKKNGPERVQEGHQTTREDADNCGLIAKKSVAPTAAKGPILASPPAKWIALGVGGALAGWSLGHGDDPVSPSGP